MAEKITIYTIAEETGLTPTAVSRAFNPSSRLDPEKRRLVLETAAKYGFTPNYFRSVFKKITGITPFEYLQRLRLARAQELLQERRFSVQQVAFQVGFNDPFYFSKACKKRTGTTPKKYAGNPKNGRGG